MTTGDDDNDVNGDGTTGSKVNDDGNGVTGDDDDDDGATGSGATGYYDDDDGNGRR